MSSVAHNAVLVARGQHRPGRSSRHSRRAPASPRPHCRTRPTCGRRSRPRWPTSTWWSSRATTSTPVLEGITNLTAAARERPGASSCSTRQLNGFMEQAFGAGADDLITLPQPTHELAFALEKAIARRRGAADPRRGSAMIMRPRARRAAPARRSPRCNLGVALADAGHARVIVDLDLQFGDVGLALGLRPSGRSTTSPRPGGSLDAEKVDGFLAEHRSGARVAARAGCGPTRRRDHHRVPARRSTRRCGRRYDFVIVDTPPGFTPEVIATIDARRTSAWSACSTPCR